MELIITWIITILVSLGIRYHFLISILKDMANNGYKLNMDNIEEISLQLDPSITQLSKVILFIPLINLFTEIKRVTIYVKERESLFCFLRTTNILEEMTMEEIDKYYKNPSSWQVLKMYWNCMPKINYIKLEDGSKIYFYYPNDKEKSLETIIITKVTGPADTLTREEQKQELIKGVTAKVDKILSKYAKKEGCSTIDDKITISSETKKEPSEESYSIATKEDSFLITEQEEQCNENKEEKGKKKVLSKKNYPKF